MKRNWRSGAMSEVISIDESRRLMELERRIQRGLDTFMEVGEALLEIRESRLYRIEHGTFEEYCRTKWGMSKSRATQLVTAAAVVDCIEKNIATGSSNPLSTIVDKGQERIKPKTESQARPLTKLPPEAQPVAWERAVDLADGKQPTAKLVEQVVAGMLAPEVVEEISEEDRRAIEECQRDVAMHMERQAGLDARAAELRNKLRYAHEVKDHLQKINEILTHAFASGEWRDFSGSEMSVRGFLTQTMERIDEYENAN
jgi:hypothetical protein